MQSGERPGGRLFEDLSRLAESALGAAGGVRADVQAVARAQAARLIEELELVRREEFEAVREMAAKARMEQEALAGRLDAVEARLARLDAKGDDGGSSAGISPQNSADRSVEN